MTDDNDPVRFDDEPVRNDEMGPAAPLVHIGYHKTATTWLQRTLFQESAGSFASPWTRGEIVQRFISVNPFDFDGMEPAGFLADGIKMSLERDLVPVLSHEQLAGNAHSGGHNSKAHADRLAAAVPGARVLIVIREQLSMVLSVYKQYVRACGVASLARYMHPPRRGNDRGIPLFDPSFLEYHRLIGYYHRLFGRENVLVLPFETLLRDREAFVGEIVGFAGARPPRSLSFEASNVGISGVALSVKRRVNMVLVRDALNPLAPVDSARVAARVKAVFDRGDRFVPEVLRQRSDQKLKGYVRQELSGRYRESNQRTASLTGLDLATYGYEV